MYTKKEELGPVKAKMQRQLTEVTKRFNSIKNKIKKVYGDDSSEYLKLEFELKDLQERASRLSSEMNLLRYNNRYMRFYKEDSTHSYYFLSRLEELLLEIRLFDKKIELNDKKIQEIDNLYHYEKKKRYLKENVVDKMEKREREKLDFFKKPELVEQNQEVVNDGGVLVSYINECLNAKRQVDKLVSEIERKCLKINKRREDKFTNNRKNGLGFDRGNEEKDLLESVKNDYNNFKSNLKKQFCCIKDINTYCSDHLNMDKNFWKYDFESESNNDFISKQLTAMLGGSDLANFKQIANDINDKENIDLFAGIKDIDYIKVDENTIGRIVDNVVSSFKKYSQMNSKYQDVVVKKKLPFVIKNPELPEERKVLDDVEQFIKDYKKNIENHKQQFKLIKQKQIQIKDNIEHFLKYFFLGNEFGYDCKEINKNIAKNIKVIEPKMNNMEAIEKFSNIISNKSNEKKYDSYEVCVKIGDKTYKSSIKDIIKEWDEKLHLNLNLINVKPNEMDPGTLWGEQLFLLATNLKHCIDDMKKYEFKSLVEVVNSKNKKEEKIIKRLFENKSLEDYKEILCGKKGNECEFSEFKEAIDGEKQLCTILKGYRVSNEKVAMIRTLLYLNKIKVNKRSLEALELDGKSKKKEYFIALNNIKSASKEIGLGRENRNVVSDNRKQLGILTENMLGTTQKDKFLKKLNEHINKNDNGRIFDK